MVDEMIELRTPRLYLRELEAGDAIDVHAYMKDERTLQYLTYSPHVSIDETLAFLKNELLNYEQTSDLVAIAIVLEESDRLIGHMQLHSYQQGSAQLCYIVNRKYWHLGYGKEALEALIDFAFKRFRLTRLLALYDEENIASQKLLESCGFVKQERIKNYYTKANTYHDVILACRYKGDEENEKRIESKI